MNNGTVIIPSFAVSRTQELIYELNNYYEYDKEIENFMKIPIYIDSPMAVSATNAYRENSYCFDDNAKKLIMDGDDPFKFPNLHYVKSQEESMRLNSVNYPKVIISASGMCTAGRVRHHLKHNLWKKENSVIFVGYQAEGTSGRKLRDGAKIVNILGEDVVVNAEVHSIEGFSGHADREGLLDWLKGFKKLPKKIFIVHGENESCTEFSKEINNKFNIGTIVPDMNDEFEIYGRSNDNDSFENLDIEQQRKNIAKEFKLVVEEFNNLNNKSHRLLNQKLLNKNYDLIKNKLIDLQQKLLDISVLLGE